MKILAQITGCIMFGSWLGACLMYAFDYRTFHVAQWVVLTGLGLAGLSLLSETKKSDDEGTS